MILRVTVTPLYDDPIYEGMEVGIAVGTPLAVGKGVGIPVKVGIAVGDAVGIELGLPGKAFVEESTKRIAI